MGTGYENSDSPNASAGSGGKAALFTQAKAHVHAVQFRAAGLTEHKQSARVVVRG
jgi:hypothetical protein